jgi:AcrR family transcriptional regulator
MSRPRSVSDRRIFEALREVLGAVGPVEWTLQNLADRAGLTPPTLVQRFGSKRALLAAYLADSADATPKSFRSTSPDGDVLARLETALLEEIGGGDADPAHVAHHLALRQLAAADAELRPLVRRAARRRRKAIRKLLREAIDAGQLRRSTRVRKLARAVEVTAEGAVATWAVHRTRPLPAWLRRDLRRALASSMRR